MPSPVRAESAISRGSGITRPSASSIRFGSTSGRWAGGRSGSAPRGRRRGRSPPRSPTASPRSHAARGPRAAPSWRHLANPSRIRSSPSASPDSADTPSADSLASSRSARAHAVPRACDRFSIEMAVERGHRVESAGLVASAMAARLSRRLNCGSRPHVLDSRPFIAAIPEHRGRFAGADSNC